MERDAGDESAISGLDGGDLLNHRRRTCAGIDPMYLRNDVLHDVPLVVRLRVLQHVAHDLAEMVLVHARPNEHHHVTCRARLAADMLPLDAETTEELPVRLSPIARDD